MFKKILLIGLTSIFLLSLVSINNARAAEEGEDFIPIQVKIPVPGCTEITDTGKPNGKKIFDCGSCTGGNTCQNLNKFECGKSTGCKWEESDLFVGAVKDAPSFVVALFRMGVTFIAILLVGAMVLAGVMYLTSFGDSKRAQTAMANMKNALYALVVTIFAYTILYQIDPRLTNLTVPKPVCCEIPSADGKGLLIPSSDTTCKEKGGKIRDENDCKIQLVCCAFPGKKDSLVTPDFCKNNNGTEKPEVVDIDCEISCSKFQTQPDCEKYPDSCEWRLKATGEQEYASDVVAPVGTTQPTGCYPKSADIQAVDQQSGCDQYNNAQCNDNSATCYLASNGVCRGKLPSGQAGCFDNSECLSGICTLVPNEGGTCE